MDYTFLASFLLVFLALIYSYFERLGIEKKIAVGSVVAFFQLALLGFVLSFLLSYDNLFYFLFTWLFMVSYASIVASKRTKLKNGIFVSFVSIFSASLAILGVLVLIGAVGLKAKEIIPITGMVVGNSLNVYTQFVDRLKGETKNRVDEIESKSAVGATLSEALDGCVRAASKASMLPTLNTLHTVGLIHIPGVTVGMILAGASPLKAVSFQLVIMFMMVAVAMFTVIFSKRLLLKRILS